MQGTQKIYWSIFRFCFQNVSADNKRFLPFLGGKVDKRVEQLVRFITLPLFTARQSKKLTFMFLANDVLQNGKRKGAEFLGEFKHILPSAFQHCSQ